MSETPGAKTLIPWIFGLYRECYIKSSGMRGLEKNLIMLITLLVILVVMLNVLAFRKLKSLPILLKNKLSALFSKTKSPKPSNW